MVVEVVVVVEVEVVDVVVVAKKKIISIITTNKTITYYLES